jgi:hypothetical protein
VGYLADSVGVVVGELQVDELGVQRGGAALQKGGQRQRVVALAGDVHVHGAGILYVPLEDVWRRLVVNADPIKQQKLRKTKQAQRIFINAVTSLIHAEEHQQF